MPRQNSINAHPDCRMLYTYTRSWSEPSREVWNVSYDGICVDCARKGPLLISPLSFFSHPCDSHSTPPPKFICLAHSNRLRLSSPSSSRSPSSLRSFSPGPEVSLVMARSIWSFCAFYIYFSLICSTCRSSFPSHLLHFVPLPDLPLNPFQPAERPSPTAASRSLPPCKFGSDKQSCLQSVWCMHIKKN